MPLSRQQGRSETEEYSSDSESESEDEEELQMILEDLQKQNEELEVRRTLTFYEPESLKFCSHRLESQSSLGLFIFYKYSTLASFFI